MSISLKGLLAGLSVLMLTMAAVQGGTAIHSISQAEDDVQVIVESRVPSFILLGQMNADLGNIRIAQAARLYDLSEPGRSENVAAALQAVVTRLDEHMASYEPLLVDQADKDFFAEFKANLLASQKIWADVEALGSQNRLDDAENLFYGASREAYAKASASLQSAVDDMAWDTQNEGALAAESMDFASTITYIMLAATMVLGLAAAIFNSRYIAAPLTRIAGAMRRLTDGDTSFQLAEGKRGDEIGAMGKALDVFRESAIANRRLEAEAAEARQRAESDRIATQEKAEADAAERLRIATSGLASALKRLASGDLSFQIEEAFAPDFEALRHDFNQSIQQLRTTMHSITQSVAAMEGGTGEIASAANDLAKRTEQQAASLEETAAAVEQITTNVANSTKRTEDARLMAERANQSAEASTSVVSDAEDAMHRIEESSRQITNIIGVIDEIAFQTNLLALNAGVEAARAGDAGRGFAVVAQEVRELAQRSANAAKEIKALINNSSSQVSTGAQLVRDAGQTLKTIGGFISQINHNIQAIATSAREQSTGLSEINHSVNTMDQATQRNAAMVEETSASSQTLANEASALRRLIGQFQLGDANPRSATKRRDESWSAAA